VTSKNVTELDFFYLFWRITPQKWNRIEKYFRPQIQWSRWSRLMTKTSGQISRITVPLSICW